MEEVSFVHFDDGRDKIILTCSVAKVLDLNSGFVELLVANRDVDASKFTYPVIAVFRGENWHASFGQDVVLDVRGCPRYSEEYVAFFLRRLGEGDVYPVQTLGIVKAGSPSTTVAEIRLYKWFRYEGDNTFSFEGLVDKPFDLTCGEYSLLFGGEERPLSQRLFRASTPEGYLYRWYFRMR